MNKKDVLNIFTSELCNSQTKKEKVYQIESSDIKQSERDAESHDKHCETTCNKNML